MRDDYQTERKQGPGLVYLVAMALFILSAFGFLGNLRWVILATQKYLPPDMMAKNIAAYLEELRMCEEQIPFFYIRIFYDLVLCAGLVMMCSGMMRFHEKARQITRLLLGFDALAFLGLAIYYKVTNFSPRLVENFHAQFLQAIIHIAFLMVLGSATFLNTFRSQQPKREPADDSKT